MKPLLQLVAALAASPLAVLSAPNPSPNPEPDATLSARATTFANPVLWQDHPDLDVFRVGDVFYYSSSTFAYSPGAPVLKSYDLVNWEPVSHSVPELTFGAKYYLNGSGTAYVKGIWASTMRYRESNDMFYWIGCIDGKTYITTSPGNGALKNRGEVTNWNWTVVRTLDMCLYDCGLLIDDDDKMWVAYGNTEISLLELTADTLRPVSQRAIYKHHETIEGSRMYKRNGWYYIFVTRPADAELVIRSKTPTGTYSEARTLVSRIKGPLNNAGFAHQGGIVQTQDDKWYYVAFLDAYPGGRIPVVAPITWTSDGWPQLVTDSNGNWGTSYPIPVETNKTVASPVGTDNFKGNQLSHEWEWNHNPDRTKYRLLGDNEGGGLVLQTTDIVTTDLFAARNTLTHRIIGPKSTGTFKLNISKMKDGDRAGAVLFRDRAAYIGVHKEGESFSLVMVNNLTLSESDWKTVGRGTIAARGPNLPSAAAGSSSGTGDIWLRITADITPAFGTSTERLATFSYSTDGVKFVGLGPAFGMSNSWRYFTGYRFGVFNFATKAGGGSGSKGGEVTVRSFSMQLV